MLLVRVAHLSRVVQVLLAASLTIGRLHVWVRCGIAGLILSESASKNLELGLVGGSELRDVLEAHIAQLLLLSAVGAVPVFVDHRIVAKKVCVCHARPIADCFKRRLFDCRVLFLPSNLILQLLAW